ncbi:MAG: ParB/RepB/Spo0J family partition protein [Deltaproteobacteria bacterium]|nr:ParB/RepB/Spo0J family partition protein [Deltaproteobacteria bacterium]
MTEPTSLVKRRALGRGLGALIPEGTPLAPTIERRVPIAEIRPNPHQPRRFFDDDRIAELAESIRQQGILQPLLVRRVDQGYELIVGERRLRAAQRAGLDRVPVVIREVTDAESMEMALVENIQRADLTPIEEALAYRQLMDELHLTQEEVANRVGKSRPVITNLLRVLSLPDEIKDEVDRGHLTVGHARSLLALGTPEEQIDMARQVMRHGLSVRETETLVAQRVSPPDDPVPGDTVGDTSVAPASDDLGLRRNVHVVALEEELTRAFGTRVRLRSKKKGGRIEIEYYSNEELEGIVNRLRR